jgi:putative transposase
MRTELCLDALRRAVAQRQPAPGLIHHSDRGTQYTSRTFQEALDSVQATPSMSRKGNCWDNAVAESFFGTLEQELVQQTPEWRSPADARNGVRDYILTFYNPVRRHSANDHLSPNQLELLYRDGHCQQAAA